MDERVPYRVWQGVIIEGEKVKDRLKYYHSEHPYVAQALFADVHEDREGVTRVVALDVGIGSGKLENLRSVEQTPKKVRSSNFRG